MNYDPWLCENSKNRKATRIIFRNRLSVLQVVLHRPRDLLRQASSEEGGLEMRLVREHVAGIVEDRLQLNFGMIAKPGLDLLSSQAPRQVWRPVDYPDDAVLAHSALPRSGKPPR